MAPLSKILFHGSDHEFAPGDTVEPREGFAWASTNQEVAKGYGSRLYTVEPIEDHSRVPGAAKEFGIYSSRKGYKVTGEVK